MQIRAIITAFGLGSSDFASHSDSTNHREIDQFDDQIVR